MENEIDKNSVEYLNEQIEKTISSQKQKVQVQKDKGNFLKRNKKLIIIFSLILIMLFIAVNIYVRWGLNYAYTKLK